MFLLEKQVDQQYTTSFLGRITFTWATPLLEYATKHKTLNLHDLPQLDHYTTSENLYRQYHETTVRKLWKRLISAHKRAFIQLFAFTIIVAVTQFIPQYVLLQILRALEARQRGAAVAVEAWLWVVALGVLVLFSSWIESWMMWIIMSRINVPIFEQLSAIIFAKAMKRKDVRGTQKKKNDGPQLGEDGHPVVVNEGSGPRGEDTVPAKDDEDEDEEAALQKTRQSIMNMISVDGNRVAQFATFGYLIPISVLKLIVAVAFLVTLIGWPSMLAGLAVSAVATPFNIWLSKRYSDAQGKVMKLRDKKTAVVTEALQGIRQIKFSAMENQWGRKIGDIRSDELHTQWMSFLYDTGLMFCWIIGPIMLSAVSLAVYAILHGGLSASVAFTTISVFASIEMTLAVIPELTTMWLDAKVSADRLDVFLGSEEKVENTIPAEDIRYESASIAWPADEGDDEDKFVLRDLNLAFPKGELSVVSGKTGSGKSLLLASILGEADILAGRVMVPRAVAHEERFDAQATPANWIITDAIAFVAQIPWLENASLKDNILFGLPYDEKRYNKVLDACALRKDLEILPDGDLTEVGANGINLSGGQKWRMSFARALYSRAGILVLDDIFSAVDPHVGRHLYEQALTGELGRGRTRILVTHHVALTLPRTKYTVLLGDGKVEHAGLVEELRKSGSLTAILEEEHKEQQIEEEQEADVDDGGALHKILTSQSKRSRHSFSGDANGKLEIKKPRKFVEDETREIGRIKMTVWNEYLSMSGGWFPWFWIVTVFALYIVGHLARVSNRFPPLKHISNPGIVVLDQPMDKVLPDRIGTCRTIVRSQVQTPATTIDDSNNQRK